MKNIFHILSFTLLLLTVLSPIYTLAEETSYDFVLAGEGVCSSKSVGDVIDYGDGTGTRCVGLKTVTVGTGMCVGKDDGDKTFDYSDYRFVECKALAGSPTPTTPTTCDPVTDPTCAPTPACDVTDPACTTAPVTTTTGTTGVAPVGTSTTATSTPYTGGALGAGFEPLVVIPGVTTADVVNKGLGPYIVGIYKTSISLSIVAAVLMFMYHAFWYTTSEAIGNKGAAKAGMKNVIYGILLILSSYLILQTINPELVNFSLNINPPSAPTVNESAPLKLGSSAPVDSSAISDSDVCNSAASILVPKGAGIYVTKTVLCIPGPITAATGIGKLVPITDPNAAEQYVLGRFYVMAGGTKAVTKWDKFSDNTDGASVADCFRFIARKPGSSCLINGSPKYRLVVKVSAQLYGKKAVGGSDEAIGEKIISFQQGEWDEANKSICNSTLTGSYRTAAPNVATQCGQLPGAWQIPPGDPNGYMYHYDPSSCKFYTANCVGPSEVIKNE